MQRGTICTATQADKLALPALVHHDWRLGLCFAWACHYQVAFASKGVCSDCAQGCSVMYKFCCTCTRLSSSTLGLISCGSCCGGTQYYHVVRLCYNTRSVYDTSWIIAELNL